MARRIIGIETEYAFMVEVRRGHHLSRGPILTKILEHARARLPHFRDLTGLGIFLGNGARFYVDAGMHPEMCTPECTDPWEVVRYVKAGEQILEDLVADIRPTIPPQADPHFLRGNVDYSGSGTSWGCHESYLHKADTQTLPEQIIPHLVSRVIFSGAGGFSPRSLGLEFSLSPRSNHIIQPVSDSSMNDRGIFHTKEEPLAGYGYNRLHVLCGNSVGSETALWLTVATTALIVALIEAGETPGAGVRMGAPVAVLHGFAADPDCREEVFLKDGSKPGTALSIQRHYLERVEGCLGKDFLPPWAEEVCRRWREILDRLQEGAESVSETLDWAMKLILYTDRIRRHGFTWDAIRVWNSFLTRNGARILLPEVHPQMRHREMFAGGLEPEVIVRYLKPWLRFEKLLGGDLLRFLKMRQELFEIDSRFGQLGEKGIFNALDRAGVLRHRQVAPSEIARAMVHPPVGTRARLRGELIRRMWGGEKRFNCSWDNILDLDDNLMLDLSDPFEREERWQAPGRIRPRMMRDPRRPLDEPPPLTEDDMRTLQLLGI